MTQDFICRSCGHTNYHDIENNLYQCSYCSVIFSNPTKFKLKPLKFKKLDPNAVTPTKPYDTDTAYDLYSLDKHIINSGEIIKVSTKIAIEPEYNIAVEIRPRSGLSKKGIKIANQPGTIDQNYRNEIIILIHNTTDRDYTIEKHDRIAQMKIEKVFPVQLIEVNELSTTDRNLNGFGSSGK